MLVLLSCFTGENFEASQKLDPLKISCYTVVMRTQERGCLDETKTLALFTLQHLEWARPSKGQSCYIYCSVNGYESGPGQFTTSMGETRHGTVPC